MLDQTGIIHHFFTGSAFLIALQYDRLDIVSLFLSVRRRKPFPVKRAIMAGYTAMFEAFLWHGRDLNGPVENNVNGPSALG